ncbi:hypothetical protein ACEPAI_3369 [Sanghuangporus weigelae]
MSDNGIKDNVFVDLMEAGLKAEIEPLTKWEGKSACILLAKAVEEAGRIMAARRLRGAGGEARLYSYVRDEDEEVDNDADNDSDLLVERDSVSGLPVSLYEHARDLLLAGFAPSQSPVLREKLNTCIDPHNFTGPVLVSRNPTMVPSDVRKVTAVSHDRLIKYKDVIIFSTKGDRSLAIYLGGGDYDGDTATVIAEPSIVSPFRNSELVLDPITVREAFEEEIEKVFHDNAAYELGYNHPETIRLAYM